MTVRRTAKLNHPTVDAQLVLYPSGNVMVFPKVRSKKGAWAARIKADGTVTPGQMERLQNAFK